MAQAVNNCKPTTTSTYQEVAGAAVGHPVRWCFDIARFGRDLRNYRLCHGRGLHDTLTNETDIAKAQQSRLERGLLTRPSINTIVKLAVWARLDLYEYIQPEARRNTQEKGHA